MLSRQPTNTFPESLSAIIADHLDYLTELIASNDLVKTFRSAFTWYNARKTLTINICPRRLFKEKHSVNGQYHEAHFLQAII